MSAQTSFKIAACLSAPLILFPNFWLAWLAILAWGVHFYDLHESIGHSSGPDGATIYVAIVGVLVVMGFALLMGTVFGLMCTATLLLVLGLRRILPKYFPVETYGEA